MPVATHAALAAARSGPCARAPASRGGWTSRRRVARVADAVDVGWRRSRSFRRRRGSVVRSRTHPSSSTLEPVLEEQCPRRRTPRPTSDRGRGSRCAARPTQQISQTSSVRVAVELRVEARLGVMTRRTPRQNSLFPRRSRRPAAASVLAVEVDVRRTPFARPSREMSIIARAPPESSIWRMSGAQHRRNPGRHEGRAGDRRRAYQLP